MEEPSTRKELRITLEVPVSSNHAYIYRRRGGAILNDRARQWMAQAEMVISNEMQQQHWETIGKEKVVVEVTHYWQDRRCRDTSNSYKILLDSLENCGVFENDRYAIVRQQDFFVDRDNPRVELVIYRLADEDPLERCLRCKYQRGFTKNKDKVGCICGQYFAAEKQVPIKCDNFQGKFHGGKSYES